MESTEERPIEEKSLGEIWEEEKKKRKKERIKKTVIVCIILSIVAILSAIVVEYNHTINAKKIEKLKLEYMELLDESMANVYEDKECIEYQLSDISYHVADIKKYDSEYIVSLVIDCTSTDKYLSSAEKKLLAYAVEDYVPGKAGNKKVTASTGDVLTVYNDDYRDSYHGQNMITVHVNGNLALGLEEKQTVSSSSSDTVFLIFFVLAICIVFMVVYFLIKIKIPSDLAAHNMERTKKGLDTDYVKYLSDTQFSTYYNTISSDILNMQLDTNEDNLCALFDVVKKERYRRLAEVKHLDYLSGMNHLNDNKQLLMNYLKDANPEKYTKEFLYFLNNYYGKNGAEEIAQQAIAAYVKFNSGVSNILEIKRKDDKDIRQYAEELYAASAPPQGLGFGIITTSVVEAAIYTALDNNERKKQMANQTYKTSSVANSGIAANNNLAAGKIKSLYDTYAETMKSIINKM